MAQFDNLALIPALEGKKEKLEALPQFLRTLLVADGTVTRSLEAYFWEAIDVVQVEQQIEACANPIESLNIDADENVLFRRVELRGRESGALYSSANSIIKIDDIPDNWRQELATGRLGIGTLISDSGMESYREITDYNLSGKEEVSRTYRIFLKRKPAILITESFPLPAYR